MFTQEHQQSLPGVTYAHVCPLQDLAEQVLGKCDGNLLAAALMGGALMRRAEDFWQAAVDDFRKTGNQVVNAIKISIADVHALGQTDSDIHAAAHSLGLLQHVRAQVRLPIPLLQLLMAVLIKSQGTSTDINPNDDARTLLELLVKHSIMCKV